MDEFFNIVFMLVLTVGLLFYSWNSGFDSGQVSVASGIYNCEKVSTTDKNDLTT